MPILSDHTESQSPLGTMMVCGLMGAFLFLCVPLFPLLTEFFERVLHAVSGGGGEKSDWGEPLLYLPFMALHYIWPWGVIGAVLGTLLGWMRFGFSMRRFRGEEK